jgi:hypothetical protein
MIHLRQCEELALHGSRSVGYRTHLRAHHPKPNLTTDLASWISRRVTNYHLILSNRPPNRGNTSYFEDPEQFNPDRCLKGPLADPFTFLPFSDGARNCIGQHLTNLMIKVELTRILTQFKLELYPNYVLAYYLVSLYSPVGPSKFTHMKMLLALLIYVFT